MISQSTQAKHRRGLARIAAVCCFLTLLSYELPHQLTAIKEFSKQGEGWHAVVRSWWSNFDPQRTSWLWLYHRADNTLTDALQRSGRQAKLAPDVVFLTIDSTSFDQSSLSEEEKAHPALQMMTGGFPFPRTIYPLIIQRLAQAGAKAIIFDILFPGPKEPEVDEPFRLALDKYADKVVIGSNLQLGSVDQSASTTRDQAFPPSRSLIDNPDRLYDARVGYVNFVPDSDGIVRRITFRTNYQEFFGEGTSDDSRELYSLSAQGVRQAGLGNLIPPGRRSALFRYLDQRKLAVRSLHEIFVPAYWQNNYRQGEFFRNKLVFIGPYGNWSKDELQTPFGTMLGPEIHLSALNALLSQEFLYQSSGTTDFVLILLGGLAAFLVGCAVSDPVFRSCMFALLAAAFIAGAFLLYNVHGYLLSLLGPMVTVFSSGFIGLVWERVLERQEKARVRQTLERYVSKDVVKEVLDNPASFLLTEGGMRKPVTILFSDIRGFTTMTESADATLLVKQLNEYFTEMVRIVFANLGTLDKFIGDAVMAHWGAIVTRGEGPDACRAVATALEMLKSVEKLNVRWKQAGMLELKIGLGINHGDAICAHIGSHEKHEMTAIGDAVNLASRLEGATKEFRQDLLIGENVAPLVRDHYVLRPVDLLQVKGKSKPVEVFAVLGHRGNTQIPEWLAIYEEGIRLFRERSFAESDLKFEEVLEEVPGDWLAREYQRRCREFLTTAPEEDWDGSYVMTQK